MGSRINCKFYESMINVGLKITSPSFELMQGIDKHFSSNLMSFINGSRLVFTCISWTRQHQLWVCSALGSCIALPRMAPFCWLHLSLLCLHTDVTANTSVTARPALASKRSHWPHRAAKQEQVAQLLWIIPKKIPEPVAYHIKAQQRTTKAKI